MTERSDFVVLTEEANSIRAHWIAGAIDAHGISAHVVDDERADEFAMAQKFAGVPLIQVLVPRDQLVEARTIFLNLSQPIPLVDEDEEDEDDDYEEVSFIPIPGKAVLIAIGVILLFGAVLLYFKQKRDEEWRRDYERRWHEDHRRPTAPEVPAPPEAPAPNPLLPR